LVAAVTAAEKGVKDIIVLEREMVLWAVAEGTPEEQQAILKDRRVLLLKAMSILRGL
jgi:hypothetical protein